MIYQLIKKYFYSFLRVFTRGGTAFAFRKIIVSGYEEVKDELPVLYVANHQNTFMDGVILVQVAYKIRPNILVRADIFKSKWAQLLLDLIHLIPIYRKRDGVDTKKANKEIFDKCIKLFKEKKAIQIFPEGNHAIERHLRGMQKGAARLAFQAEEQNDFNLGLKIVPVGLHYENHSERWYDAHVHFGEPIDMADLRNEYENNPQKAIHDLTDRLKKLIAVEMLDIRWREEYDFFEDLRTIIKPYAEEWCPHQKSYVHAENDIIHQLEEALKDDNSKLKNLKQEVNNYLSTVKEAGLSKDYQPKEVSYLSFIKNLILLVPGMICWSLMKLVNMVPQYIIENKVIKGIKDRTWHISLRAALGSFLYPIYYGILWLLLSIFMDWTLAGIIIFTLPLLSIFYFETELLVKKWKNQLALLKHNEILVQEQKLVNTLKSLLKQ